MNPSATGSRTNFNSYSASENSTELRFLGTNPDDTQSQSTDRLWPQSPENLADNLPDARNNGTVICSTQTQYRFHLFIVVIAIFLSNFVLYYAHEALVNPSPTLGKLLFPPSTTVFVINVLSQGVAFLIAHLFTAVFEALRWKFASRRIGVRMTTFLSLSGATSLLGVGRLLCARGTHQFWCLQRLLYPVLCSFVAVILTFGISYRNVYTPGLTIPVLAGLAPVNASLVGLIQASVMCVYFSTWSYGILTVSKFVTGISSETCNQADCLSVFLPGGLEIARLRTGNLNSTLLNGTTLDNSATILINNAPGYQLDFFGIEPGYSFDPDDCMIYGQQRGEGLQICLASVNSTLKAGFPSNILCADLGWSVCPSDLYLTGNCFSNTSWFYSLQQTTSLNVFKRYSTVAYDRRNLSILSIESISPPEPVKINASDLHSAFSYTLTPGPNATSDDTELTNAVLFQIGWVLRLTQDDFPDDYDSPLNFLRGFLTIPIQFSTTAWQFVNATYYALEPQSDLYALPSDLDTTASAAHVTYRTISTKPWLVFVFMAVVVTLLLWSFVLFAYEFLQKTIVPNTSSFSEIDVSSKAAYPPSGVEILRPGCEYNSVLREAGLANAESTKIINALKRKVIRVVETDGGRPHEKVLLLTLADRDGEPGELNGFESLTTGIKY